MKMKRNILVGVGLSCLMLLSSVTIAFADNVNQIMGDGNTVIFIDVPSNYWAKDQIDFFAEQGIAGGYEDGSFRPDAGVTREEFCKLLVSTFRPGLETPATPTFADVAEDRWSYPYIEVCSEFLTGYANPFGGLPTFHPTEYATREDIAVALVKMMGLRAEDAIYGNYAVTKFSDGADISPGLAPYVSLACEKGLINGYPDGTFGPTQGITRAETIVLLNRATKQAATDIHAELELSAKTIPSKDGKTVTVNIIGERGVAVTVNGESVKMSDNRYDEYEGNYVYKFQQEGSKNFVIEGKKGGKTKTINLSAKYEAGAPKLSITTCPTTTDTKDIVIKGLVSDANDEASQISVTINGSPANMYYDEWRKELTLTEGENVFTIVATNSLGKSTTEKRTVFFEMGAPEIQLLNCPKTTAKSEITIKGRIRGQNEGALLFINDEECYLNYYGEFNATVDLKEGDNRFTFRAVNNDGKEVSETRVITYTPEKVEEEMPTE